MPSAILDVDGTLIDSNDAHALAWVDVGAETDHVIEFERVRWMIGMGSDRLLPLLTGLREKFGAGKAHPGPSGRDLPGEVPAAASAVSDGA